MSTPKHKLRSFLRAAKNNLKTFNEVERYVREATSNDPWPCTSTLMLRIVHASDDHFLYDSMLTMLIKRLQDSAQITHVKKALILTEFLLLNGNSRFVNDCKSRLHIIHNLSEYQYLVEGQDKGADVRHKAKDMIELLTNDELLSKERKLARRVRSRLNGFSYDQRIAEVNYLNSSAFSLNHRECYHSPQTRTDCPSFETSPNSVCSLPRQRRQRNQRHRAACKKQINHRQIESNKPKLSEEEESFNANESKKKVKNQQIVRAITLPKIPSGKKARSPSKLRSTSNTAASKVDVLTGGKPMSPAKVEPIDSTISDEWLRDVIAAKPRHNEVIYDDTPALFDNSAGIVAQSEYVQNYSISNLDAQQESCVNEPKLAIQGTYDTSKQNQIVLPKKFQQQQEQYSTLLGEQQQQQQQQQQPPSHHIKHAAPLLILPYSIEQQPTSQEMIEFPTSLF